MLSFCVYIVCTVVFGVSYLFLGRNWRHAFFFVLANVDDYIR